MIAQTTLALTLDAVAVRRRAGVLVRLEVDALAARPGGRGGPGPVHARPGRGEPWRRSADKRHVTFDTQQCSFDGTMHLEANLEIPDALALAAAVASGAEHLAKLGVDRHRRWPEGDRAR